MKGSDFYIYITKVLIHIKKLLDRFVTIHCAYQVKEPMEKICISKIERRDNLYLAQDSK